LLTGTPLQNDMKELYTLLHFLEPMRFGDMDSFLEDFGDLKTNAQVEKLHQKLGPYILRRMKEDVATFIPQKEETLVTIELTNVQKAYYKGNSIFKLKISYIGKK
jgi:SNF2 family DNA or RNA helicase